MRDTVNNPYLRTYLGFICKNMFSLSIITVVYNDLSGLRKTFNSLSKLKKKFEYLVIDGGSSDGSVKEIKNFDLIDKYISEKDQGTYDAMNKGINLAQGEYISFLNAGDEALKNYLDSFEKYRMNDREKDFFYAGVQFATKRKKNFIPKRFNKNMEYLQRMPFPHPGLYVRRNIFEKIGFFDINKKLTADHDWIVRMINSGSSGKLINEPVTLFSLDGKSNSYETIFEMKLTAIKHGRNKILANVFLLRGFISWLYYFFLRKFMS